MTTVSLSRGLVIVVFDKYLAAPAYFLVMMWSWTDVDRGQEGTHD